MRGGAGRDGELAALHHHVACLHVQVRKSECAVDEKVTLYESHFHEMREMVNKLGKTVYGMKATMNTLEHADQKDDSRHKARPPSSRAYAAQPRSAHLLTHLNRSCVYAPQSPGSGARAPQAAHAVRHLGD